MHRTSHYAGVSGPGQQEAGGLLGKLLTNKQTVLVLTNMDGVNYLCVYKKTLPLKMLLS